MRVIDITKHGNQVLDLRKKFASRIVGQSEATEGLTNLLERYLSGLNDPTRPIASALFIGPTGTGKTAVVEALCEGLYGDTSHMIKIDCAEFQYGHEIAKLIGSPPGYLGHKETPAVLTQRNINTLQTPDVPFTVVLFDEIEKASDELWHLLLGILDKGGLTLGDNSKTNFSKCIIIMTSNVGARQLAASADGEGSLGFVPPISETKSYRETQDISMSAARKKFTTEFLNRLDEIVTFHTLSKDQIEEIMGMEVAKIQGSLLSKCASMVNPSPAAFKELLVRGYDKRYNARGIRRTLEREIMTPIARAISSGQIGTNENIVMDFIDGAFKFYALGERVNGANQTVKSSVLSAGQLPLPLL